PPGIVAPVTPPPERRRLLTASSYVTWPSYQDSVLAPTDPCQRLPKRPGREHPDEVLLVLGRAAQIRARLRRLRCELGRALDCRVVRPLPLEEGLSGRGFDRDRPHVGEADARARTDAARIQLDLHGHRRRREVTHLALELQVGASTARSGGRHTNLH